MSATNGEPTSDERHRTRRFFNLVAPAFLVIDRRLLPEYRRTLFELQLPADRTVLDVATGTGSLALAFAEQGHPVTAFDFAERLLKTARRRMPDADVRRMDLVDLPQVPDHAYDIVAMGYLLHGLSPQLARLALREGARIARRHVLVFDYRGPGPWYVRLIEWLEGPHYPEFVSRPFPNRAAEAGLEIEASGEASDISGWWLCRPVRPPVER